MVKAYYKRLTGDDEKARAEAGLAWVSTLSSLAGGMNLPAE